MIVSAMQDGMANRIADYGCAMKRKLRRVRAATQWPSHNQVQRRERVCRFTARAMSAFCRRCQPRQCEKSEKASYFVEGGLCSALERQDGVKIERWWKCDLRWGKACSGARELFAGVKCIRGNTYVDMVKSKSDMETTAKSRRLHQGKRFDEIETALMSKCIEQTVV
ncbi:hypothetical protein Naga_100006g62 [Nannochloropsis gaditana]|uniref:Uncharacterized protein n=1 Tax=Nannochloropsis gaditana TaxID=72520 RepID=W7TQU1_9STRA|nr:hypothetical protein Naga_100006g62 [Nannochloropsis gaditana]